MGSRLALATQDWEGHLAGDGECLNQNEGARPPRDRTGAQHMDLIEGKYKMRPGCRAQGKRRQAALDWSPASGSRPAKTHGEPRFACLRPVC